MQLPNSNRNVINRRKLINYCSNLNHADGCHKARVSESALGLNLVIFPILLLDRNLISTELLSSIKKSIDKQ